MPILQENMSKYPGGSIRSKEWQAIRESILVRAGHCCEWCGVKNYDQGWRDKTGKFFSLADNYMVEGKVFKIVLTIAHIDHDPANNNPDNLKALCQRCHNRYDQHHRKHTIRSRKAIRDLFDD